MDLGKDGALLAMPCRFQRVRVAGENGLDRDAAAFCEVLFRERKMRGLHRYRGLGKIRDRA